MGFIEATHSALTRPFDFSGRSTRSEYWWFFLASMTIVPLGLFIPLFILAMIAPPLALLAGVIAYFYLAFVGWSLMTRRVRDAGGSPFIVLAAVLMLVVTYAFGAMDIIGYINDAAPAGATDLSYLDDPAALERAAPASFSTKTLVANFLSGILSLTCLVFMFLPTKE